MIVGVDLSTKEVHLVRREDGETDAFWRRLVVPDLSAFAERDALAARAFASLLREDLSFWEGVWLAGVEYPFTAPNRIASVGLKTILGAIVATIPTHVHVIPLPARLWTPWFLREDPDGPLPKVPRKSADRKPLIAARALALLDSDDIWSQDAYDAYGISWAVERMNDEGIARTATQNDERRTA